MINIGDFNKDVKEGFGAYIYKSKNETKLYLGFWKKNSQSGLGKVYSKKSARYGLFSEGERLKWFDNERIAFAQLDSNNTRYKKLFNLSFDELLNKMSYNQINK